MELLSLAFPVSRLDTQVGELEGSETVAGSALPLRHTTIQENLAYHLGGDSS